ncbi:hypothetical protein Aab01nite_07620 [Paractinoplanes abujensis]|uniref:Uncharacterized protein n=1 Tax=Paractinoplanes abujensis TaxID=882441 RepID=A0A7W7CQF8_9ACTN|nr:hypothetical protein [Actinoplanes abujensis]MBB4691415.1 hypothetical protein [Actinoplanes abujensis]GID17172.1 hypothetical protein Aab01nite_07620 [Actinoplanes abujensis]
MTDTCPVCGEPAGVLTGLGPRVSLNEADVAGLITLFDDDALVPRCDANSCRLPVQPMITMAVAGPPAGAWMVPGSVMAGEWEAFLAGVRADAPGLAVRTVPSVGDLRVLVTRLLGPRVALLRKALAAGDRRAFVAENVAELTPAVFAAGAFALTGPGFGLDLPARTRDRPTAELLGDLQAGVWWLIALFWLRASGDLRLDDLLHRFADDTVVLPGALDALNAHIGEPGDETRWVVPYSLEALRATVCLAAGQPNPERQRWSDLYFGFELARRGGGWDPGSSLHHQGVSDERAAATIGLHAAWITVGERIRALQDEGSPELTVTVQRLDEICGQAGHPKLVAALLGEN